MPTKLIRYCDGILEAAWLAAVLVVPLFFNVYSSRIFEPDKIALLRTLALVALAAWLVKIIETGRSSWEQLSENGSPWKNFLKTPMVLPAVALMLVYLIATVFSVSPAVSLWGSYQRLQGTYTTLSYLVFFGAIIGNMRQRKQVDRLITTMIVASLPVALYGVLQRYRLDPIPWGGDTTIRIAANMGNSIFVAAYLIMVVPLTMARIVEKFRAILRDSERVAEFMVLATIYVFIGALQVIAIYMSGSRGPAIGWLAGMFVFFLLLSLYWQKRWLTVGLVMASGLVIVFVLVLNLASGPFASLRASPAVGRFGSLLDLESSSALVRRYIWEGVVNLVSPHEPLEFPDGSTDRLNFLRPLVGYGPESMYVAYNKFYVPALGKVERRNASPDRSHNETWDSMVITGALGLFVYFVVFAMVFYYGFKWLGLIVNRKRRNLFLGLYIGGGLGGALFFSIWRGVEYLGVGMPFGIFLGLILYVVIVALFFTTEKPANDGQVARFLLLLGMVSAILAYFVESNFGISIAVTRTYFWIYAGLMVVVGVFLPRLGAYGYAAAGELAGRIDPAAGTLHDERNGKQTSTAVSRRKKEEKRAESRIPKNSNSQWLLEALIGGGIIGIILITLGFDFISNTDGNASVLAVLANFGSDKYFGIVFLLLTTWILSAVVITLSGGVGVSETPRNKQIGLQILVVLGVSGAVGLIYYMVHASRLAALARYTVTSIEGVMVQVGNYEQLLASYYIFILLLVFGIALAIAAQARAEALLPVGNREPERLADSWVSVVWFVIFMVGAFYLTSVTNLRVIQADIAFKIGDSFAQPGSWHVATRIYERAIALAPSEDFYYLFLGRANLEESKTIESAAARDNYVMNARDNLLNAQAINPLNTDHTANLARLYSTWASVTTDSAAKQERSALSSDYFSKAVVLSPNNARLWSEWALHMLSNVGDEAQGRQLIATALEKDPEYDWAYGLLGDLTFRNARATQSPEDQKQLLEEAAGYYQKALGYINPYEPQNIYSYQLSLAGIFSLLGQHEKAIQAYIDAGNTAAGQAQRWQIEEAISEQYLALNDPINALIHLQNALSVAPEDQKTRLQQLISQISAQP